MTSSSKLYANYRDDWETPRDFFAACSVRWGPFDCDVAASPANALCEAHITAEQDALVTPWSAVNWCNPPYSQKAAFIERAALEGRANTLRTVMLLPASTGEHWWHDAARKAKRVVLIRGRLQFALPESGTKGGNPGGSCLMIFGSATARTPIELWDWRPRK